MNKRLFLVTFCVITFHSVNFTADFKKQRTLHTVQTVPKDPKKYGSQRVRCYLPQGRWSNFTGGSFVKALAEGIRDQIADLTKKGFKNLSTEEQTTADALMHAYVGIVDRYGCNLSPQKEFLLNKGKNGYKIVIINKSLESYLDSNGNCSLNLGLINAIFLVEDEQILRGYSFIKKISPYVGIFVIAILFSYKVKHVLKLLGKFY